MERFKKFLILTFVVVSLVGIGLLLFDNYVYDVISIDLDGKHSFSVEVNDPAGGTITVDQPKGDVKIGTVINLKAKPNYGYVFSGWYVDDECVSADTEFAYIMPNNDVVVTAVFAKEKFNVSVISMNPAFENTIEGEYEYLDVITVSANKIEGTEFLAWFVDGEVFSIEDSLTFTVESDITIYAEYYTYGAVEVYSWPTANAAPLGTPLSEVELVGGKANVLGYFKWADPEMQVYEGGEYIVVFIPFATSTSEHESFISVPIAEQVLSAPKVVIENGVATWNGIDGAVGYTVYINGVEYDVDSTATSYQLPTSMNEYFVSVSAVGDGVLTASSKQGNIERYVPEKPEISELDFGIAKSEYDENGEMVKFGGTVPVTPEYFDLFDEENIVYTKEGFAIDVTVDIADMISSSTKKELIFLNKIAEAANTEILLTARIEVIDPKVYLECDNDFPFSMNDLAFGVSYTSIVTTILSIKINGEFVEAEQRRGTLHLLFIDLVGLEEPIYKWKEIPLYLKGTPFAVEFAVGFDAIGAIAASLVVDYVEVSEYYAGIHVIENGEPVFVPYFSREVKSNVTNIEFDGEFDVSLNCVRLSASLQIVKSEEEKISIVRLNLDAANVDSDLSGNVNVNIDHTNPEGSEITEEETISGSYRFYGQITFEYYFEIRLNFGFLPLDDFGIKLLDGSYILAEWEYFKGGIPKTPYKDEAIHITTPIFATDGKTEYFIDVDGNLIETEVGQDYSLADNFADLDTERIVDIDDHYIYVLSGNKLRRIGRVAGTERTILSNVSSVLYSDRNYIYYTTVGDPTRICKLYRSDIESSQPAFADLPGNYSALSMRYDNLNECYVIYSTSADGKEYYFSFDGVNLIRNNANEHKWWQKQRFDGDIMAYYSADENGILAEAFIRSENGGVTHADSALSVGISPIGLFVVNEKAGDVYNYELGLYPLGLESGAYVKIAEVSDPYVANRIAYYDGKVYFLDMDGAGFRIMKTDGKNTSAVAISEFSAELDSKSIFTEIHGDWFFVYECSAGKADVVYTIDIYSLDTAPYMAGGNTQSFDKGNPQDTDYIIGGKLDVYELYLNTYSDDDYKKLLSDTENAVENWNKVNNFLKEKANFWKDAEVSKDDVINYLNEYGEFFKNLDITVTKVAEVDEYLGNIVVTITADELIGYSYGLHSGAIVTSVGILPIKINVVDSRMPVYTPGEVPDFDNGAPMSVNYEITLYDSEYELVDVPADAYEVKSKDGVYAFTFYPHYLATLDYGLNGIILRSEGEEFSFDVNVKDSRTPRDSEYLKHFDLTYPKNVVFEFELYDEKAISNISGSDLPEMGAYTINYDGEGVTFFGKYLSTLSIGDYVYTVTTAEGSFEITIRVIKSIVPEAPTEATHDLSIGNDLGIAFDRNDAVYFDLYIDGSLVSNSYWRYSFVSNKIEVDNDYLLANYGYGKHRISIRSIIYSGDDIKSHVNNIALTLTDSRSPVLGVTDVIYVIGDGGTSALEFPVYTYQHQVISITADGTRRLDFDVISNELYGRSVNVKIHSREIVDILSEGSHTLTIMVGEYEFTLNLIIRDERLPCVTDDSYSSYNVDYPSSVAYIVRLYGERFISLSYNGEILPDDAFKFALHSDNALYHILIINEDYLASLNLVYDQVVHFVVTTNVNQFAVSVICQPDPNNPNVKPDGDPEHEDPKPVDITTQVYLSPDNISVDKANVGPITVNASYGTNNAFGRLVYNLHTLVEGKDYSFGADGKTTIIFSSSFVKTLSSYGDHYITLYGEEGKSDSLTVSVYDSRDPYVGGNLEAEYDKYDDNYLEFAITLYDSKVSYIRVGETKYTSGIKSGNDLVWMNNSLLDSFDVGEQVAYIGFNDTEAEIPVSLNVRDTALYYTKGAVDKYSVENDEMEFTFSWMLYEGSVESCVSETLKVVSFDNVSITLSGFYSASYGDHELIVVANGHRFVVKVNLYDSRNPVTEYAEYTFDKGSYEYTLDPNVASTYDLRIILELYDKEIDGLDLFSHQTIRGNEIEYEDYEREGNDYLISYFYLYRLPIGSYKFYISTTGGDVEFTVNITDSRAPYLLDEPPFIYDCAVGGDKEIQAFLYEDKISSLSYVDIISGNDILLVENRDFTIEDGENNSKIIVIKESLLLKEFYDGCSYKFTLATNTERVLTFEITIENGPRRPFIVTYYSVPWKEGEPEYYIESVVLYEGDMIPVPETPSYNYYRFLGFYTERSGGQLFDFTQPVSSDCNIFLHWEPEQYDIILMSEGEVINTLKVAYMSEIPDIGNPTRAGYTFVKWTLDEEHNIRFNPNGETMPHKSITLYAEWQINRYNVTFKDRNGSILKTETLLAYESATPPADESMQVEHYIFKGWDKDYSSVLSDLVVTAVYEAVKYDITYVLDEGTLPSSAPKYYTIEGGVKLVNPTKTGYDFLGWYLDEHFTSAPMTEIPYGTLPGLTLYARFEVSTYDVYLNSTVNGVTYEIYGAPMDNKLRITYGDEYTLPRVIVPNGYFFLGWYSGNAGSGTKFANYDGSADGNWSYAGNITLYAHVVSIVDFKDINVTTDSVSFGISNHSSFVPTITAVELCYGNNVVASLSPEELESDAFSFSDLIREVVYEIKLSYTYTVNGLDIERSTYTSFKIKITDDSYPETIVGNTIAEIKIGSEVFESLTIDSVIVRCDGEEVSYHTLINPGVDYSYLADGGYWMYFMDLLNNTDYEIEISYTYTHMYYSGTYTSTVIVPITTGVPIFGIPEPIPTVSTSRVSEGSSTSGDYRYYYYSYNLTFSLFNNHIEPNVRLVGWQLIYNDEVVTSGTLDALIGGPNASHTINISRSFLTDEQTYEIVFTYAYDLQDGMGQITEDHVYAFVANTIDSEYLGLCLAAGTEILMADGSVKKIEDIEYGDYILVWNFYTGKLDVAPVFFVQRDVIDHTFTLHFEGGKSVEIGQLHGFFVDGKFETVTDDNAEEFIGRTFYVLEDGELVGYKLESVEYNKGEVDVFGLITGKTYNHFANGFLNVMAYVDIVNIFDYDGFKYDEAAMKADLEKYGLLEYETAAEYVSREEFELFAGEYMSVVIGKGYYTFEEIIELLSKYSEHLGTHQ